jgi:hypothetical protein
MVERSNQSKHAGGRNGTAAPPEWAGRLVSAKPLRSRRASEHLAETLETLGADQEVIDAARKG